MAEGWKPLLREEGTLVPWERIEEGRESNAPRMNVRDNIVVVVEEVPG